MPMTPVFDITKVAIPTSPYGSPMQQSMMFNTINQQRFGGLSMTERRDVALEMAGIKNPWKTAAEDTAKAFKGAADTAGAAFAAAVPGLPGAGATPVTAQDLALAQLGAYQEKPDEYLRRLRDEVAQRRDIYPDVDIADAARRAGINAALPPELILSQFEQLWQSGALFANPANLGLIDVAAVQRAQAEQQRAALGTQNVQRLIQGLPPLAPQAGLISGAAGGAAGPGPLAGPLNAALAGVDLAGSLTGAMDALKADKAFAESAAGVGKLMATNMAAGWQAQIGSTPWATALETAIIDSILAAFAPPGGNTPPP
jgi:hypothetical protein